MKNRIIQFTFLFLLLSSGCRSASVNESVDATESIQIHSIEIIAHKGVMTEFRVQYSSDNFSLVGFNQELTERLQTQSDLSNKNLIKMKYSKGFVKCVHSANLPVSKRQYEIITLSPKIKTEKSKNASKEISFAIETGCNVGKIFEIKIGQLSKNFILVD